MVKSILIFAVMAILLVQFGCGTPPVKTEPDNEKKITEKSDPDEKIIVYITPEGEKYHRQDCQHVRGKEIAISLAEAKRRGYKPCKACSPPQ